MKNQILYTIILVVAGACLGFFGLVYWNSSTRMDQVKQIEDQATAKLQASEDILNSIFSANSN